LSRTIAGAYIFGNNKDLLLKYIFALFNRHQRLKELVFLNFLHLYIIAAKNLK